MTRSYQNEQLVVHWTAERCVHVGFCVNALVEVFDRERRPWIELGETDVDEIVRVVENCPSGALTYERLDGGGQEKPEDPVSIVPWPNGPLFVRGSFEVRDRHGNTFDTGPRAALCRCGQSRNHPFCDLSHRDAGFRSYPQANREQ